MCDEEATYTEQLKSWLKEHEPTHDQIQNAFTKLHVMLAKYPERVNGDTDECLEVLTLAYGKAGGSVGDLLSAIDAKKESAGNAEALTGNAVGSLDYGVLYEVSDAPAVLLDPSEKRAEFLRLKDQLSRKTSAA